MKLQQLACILAALWAGIMIGVGYIFAPIAFKYIPLPPIVIGRVAGEAFTAVAYVSLALGVVLLMIVRHLNSRAGFSTPNAPFLLALAALSLAIVGQFIVFPEVVNARDFGAAKLSFAALHGISSAIYLVQVIVLLLLSWRLTQPISVPKHVKEALDVEAQTEKKAEQEAAEKDKIAKVEET